MLSDFLKIQMQAQQIKAVDVRRRSGNRISVSNINKIVNDLSGGITVETADALAKGLRVPLLDVIYAALNREDQTEPNTPAQQLCQAYTLLNADQTSEIDYLLEVVMREIERILRTTDQD